MSRHRIDSAADHRGVIRVWNAAAAQMFGHTPADHRPDARPHHPRTSFREQHWTGFRRTGRTRGSIEASCLDARCAGDSTTIYVELTFAIILDAAAPPHRRARTTPRRDRALRARAQRAQARAEGACTATAGICVDPERGRRSVSTGLRRRRLGLLAHRRGAQLADFWRYWVASGATLRGSTSGSSALQPSTSS
ncbi:MAG: hypothetical protein U0360_10585 [Dehalococcoidia bacterium]